MADTKESTGTLDKKSLKNDENIVRIPYDEGFLQSTLPRIAGVIPFAAWFIVVNEFCERFAFYGGSLTFQNYIENPEQTALQRATLERQPGALDKGQSAATALSNYFMFWAYFTPLIGATVADQYWGKYKTILTFSIIYMVGWIVLCTSSIPSGYMEDGTPTWGGFAFPGYIISITIIGLGTGGIKSVVSPMCADQIPKESYMIEKNGKQYIVDPDLTVQHLYNWFYWAINIGSLIGQTVCTTLERSAFWKAYLLPSCMFLLSICIFYSGRKRYVHVPPEGSVILKAYQCIRYSFIRKRKYKATVQPTSKNFAFLDYASSLPGETQDEVAQRKWGDAFPAELRQTLKACSIFPLLTIYWVCYSQMTNNLISQAGQMKRPSWMSNDLINIMDPLILVIIIPIFDYGLYPYLSRKNIHFGYMKRIAIGFFLGGASMAVAAVVQKKIYEAPPGFDHPGDVANDISVWWQIPSYVLIATSEVFASIGSLEYSYTHAPTSMKCLISALSLLPNAGAALIGIFLSPASKDPNMHWMYAGTAVAAGISTVIFYLLFRKFDVEDKEMLDAARALRVPNPKTAAEKAEAEERM
ncbi:hypothetical protein SpCBS45565_g03361 [Spizellomyces sp. 'palustris']|nr:hypothetical protein SpCBS45565_g03361 [Spizellomyces sp. 'palustris']